MNSVVVHSQNRLIKGGNGVQSAFGRCNHSMAKTTRLRIVASSQGAPKVRRTTLAVKNDRGWEWGAIGMHQTPRAYLSRSSDFSIRPWQVFGDQYKAETFVASAMLWDTRAGGIAQFSGGVTISAHLTLNYPPPPPSTVGGS